MEEIKFAWIVFCFFLSLAVIPFSFSRFFAVHISAALFFTVLSDYFLLLRQSYLTGLLLFCLVQICYISLSGGFVKLKSVLYSLPPYAAAIFFLELDALIMVAGLYAFLFFMNISLALRAFLQTSKTASPFYAKERSQNYALSYSMKKPNGIVFISGLILFILCDVNVLIYNLKNYVDLVEKLPEVAVLLIWVFYTPAQFLLAVSGLDFNSLK